MRRTFATRIEGAALMAERLMKTTDGKYMFDKSQNPDCRYAFVAYDTGDDIPIIFASKDAKTWQIAVCVQYNGREVYARELKQIIESGG